MVEDGKVAYLWGYMRTHCIGHGRPWYAIKQLRNSGSHKMEAAINLAVEAKFLASIWHPNIVKMRGTMGHRALLTLELSWIVWC
jgi:hypothetical protein